MKSNIVTQIKELTSKRRLIYIDYEPAFALYISELKKYNIKNDEHIDDIAFNEIINELLPKRATTRAMNLLLSKDYTESELYNKLKASYYPESCIQYAIAYVKQFGYINDERYVKNYIDFKAGKKSKKQIEMFLSSKRIDRNIIYKACEEFYSDNTDIEFEHILEQMRKKANKYNELGYKEQSKLMSYFYNKGFNTDNIKKALDIIVNESYNTYFS